jgi:PEP-CTERM putative exosortase interaction domain
MKKTITAIIILTIAIFASNANADITISDANKNKDGNTLFQLFNSYFDTTFTSSNELYNAHGVDSNTEWITNGTQLVGAFKVAALGHELTMVDQFNNTLATIANVNGTTNIHSANGITDLSGSMVADIADGQQVNFNLTTSGGANYTWSSDANQNKDGMVHMIALDVTDLYNAKYGTDNATVYMFGWEDLPKGHSYVDWDYQDFVVIMTNLNVPTMDSSSTNATPEPATMLMIGLGFAGAGFVARRNGKK